MPRPKLTIKSKRNNFTLTKEAQEIIDKQSNKSKFVSQAIILKSNLAQ
jgi:macrodomain Ter protein organizer (MatP/YcbG family)